MISHANWTDPVSLEQNLSLLYLLHCYHPGRDPFSQKFTPLTFAFQPIEYIHLNCSAGIFDSYLALLQLLFLNRFPGRDAPDCWFVNFTQIFSLSCINWNKDTLRHCRRSRSCICIFAILHDDCGSRWENVEILTPSSKQSGQKQIPNTNLISQPIFRDQNSTRFGRRR